VPLIDIRVVTLEALQDIGFLLCIHADQDDPVCPLEDIEIFKALDVIGLRACKKE
jgi:dihydroorotase